MLLLAMAEPVVLELIAVPPVDMDPTETLTILGGPAELAQAVLLTCTEGPGQDTQTVQGTILGATAARHFLVAVQQLTETPLQQNCLLDHRVQVAQVAEPMMVLPEQLVCPG
jgi:hypothetical protein